MKDFVYKIADFTDEQIYPRLIATEVGDIITTNTIAVPNTSNTAEVGTVSLSVGNYLIVGENGFLTLAMTGEGNNATAATTMPSTGMVWKVVKEYTMPDTTQPGVKIQRVQ